jgi:hypothetical protein
LGRWLLRSSCSARFSRSFASTSLQSSGRFRRTPKHRTRRLGASHRPSQSALDGAARQRGEKRRIRWFLSLIKRRLQVLSQPSSARAEDPRVFFFPRNLLLTPSGPLTTRVWLARVRFRAASCSPESGRRRPPRSRPERTPAFGSISVSGLPSALLFPLARRPRGGSQLPSGGCGRRREALA